MCSISSKSEVSDFCLFGMPWVAFSPSRSSISPKSSSIVLFLLFVCGGLFCVVVVCDIGSKASSKSFTDRLCKVWLFFEVFGAEFSLLLCERALKFKLLRDFDTGSSKS